MGAKQGLAYSYMYVCRDNCIKCGHLNLQWFLSRPAMSYSFYVAFVSHAVSTSSHPYICLVFGKKFKILIYTFIQVT